MPDLWNKAVGGTKYTLGILLWMWFIMFDRKDFTYKWYERDAALSVSLTNIISQSEAEQGWRWQH